MAEGWQHELFFSMMYSLQTVALKTRAKLEVAEMLGFFLGGAGMDGIRRTRGAAHLEPS